MRTPLHRGFDFYKRLVCDTVKIRKDKFSNTPSMVFQIDNIRENPVTLLRRAGYTFQRQDNGEMSFVRPLASSGYPRFHLYTHLKGSSLLVSFHLDQKKHTYGDDTRHHGEYDESGPLKEEADRIKKMLVSTPPPSPYEVL